MQLSKSNVTTFQDLVWDFYRRQGRCFAWRQTKDPYHILVSEVMLQQTQTYRVEPKYEQFVALFPNFATLAQAPLRDLLNAWQGLGYNRRALVLHKTAKMVVDSFAGAVPDSPDLLQSFPGIGKATAASICAFAFNKPTVFIETNIRAVFIHTFFKSNVSVNDNDILPLVEKTLDATNSREWYYALMDYGVQLKKTHKNPNKKSAHYTKQSRFEGSDRQIRGAILKSLTACFQMSKNEIVVLLKKEPARVDKVLEQLCNEGFIKRCKNYFSIV